jgi:hypothetical protein
MSAVALAAMSAIDDLLKMSDRWCVARVSKFRRLKARRTE